MGKYVIKVAILPAKVVQTERKTKFYLVFLRCGLPSHRFSAQSYEFLAEDGADSADFL
jgi:hypothetical protein